MWLHLVAGQIHCSTLFTATDPSGWMCTGTQTHRCIYTRISVCMYTYIYKNKTL